MAGTESDRVLIFRASIERFLQERRDAKLDKLAPDDPKRDELIAQFTTEAWIDDAAHHAEPFVHCRTGSSET